MDKKRKNRMLSIILVLTLVLSCADISGCGNSSAKALSEYWAQDSNAAESLRSYVAKITNKKDTA